MKSSGDELALVMLGMTQAVALYGIFMPNIADVRDATVGDETHKDMIVGEFGGTGLVLSFGIIGTIIAESPLPLIFAVLVASLMVAVYEWSLRSSFATNPRSVSDI